MGEYINSRHAVALNSCTAALHLSLVAAGIGNNDEVITTPFTFTSTAEVIIHQGAKPVFVDIEEDTYNINPLKIEEKINEKTKAIIPVHYGGHPCDMDQIMEIAADHDLIVIEDAAHALGALYKNKMIGSIGDTTCFSFYATKNLTTVEGGMVTTDNDQLAEKIRILSLHGISKDAWRRYSSQGSWYYDVMYAGYKCNMTDLQASIGIHQMEKFYKMQKRREKIVKTYNKEFENMSEIILPTVRKEVEHAWHLYPIQLRKKQLQIDRNEFINILKSENIGTSVHFIPLHLQPYYKHQFSYTKGDYPIAEKTFERIVSLPLFPDMSDEEVDYVVNTIKKVIRENSV